MERFNFYLNNLDESWKAKFAAGFASVLATGALHGEGSKQTPNSTVIVHNDTQKEKTFHEHASEILKKHEGVRLKAYKDSKGNSTIGVGHMLTKESPARFKSAFGDEGEKLHKHVIGGGSLTEEQSDKLLKADIDHHVERAKKLMPNFDKYPAEHRAHLLSGVYRGDLSGSPKTLKLINEGKFKEASKEYLNNKEYRESKKLGDKSGIHKRMDEVASHIGKLSEAKLEEMLKAPSEMSTFEGQLNRKQRLDNIANKTLKYHDVASKLKERGSKQSSRVYGKFLKGMMIHGRANDEASVDARVKGKQIVKSLRKYDNLSLKESLRSPAETLAKTGDLDAAERRQKRLGAIKHVANTSGALFKRISQQTNTDRHSGNISVGEKIHLPATNNSNQKIGNRAVKANHIIGRVNTLGGDKSRKQSKYRSIEARQFRLQRNFPDKWKVQEQPDKKYLSNRLNFKLERLHETLRTPPEILAQSGDIDVATTRQNRLNKIHKISKKNTTLKKYIPDRMKAIHRKLSNNAFRADNILDRASRNIGFFARLGAKKDNIRLRQENRK